MSSIREVVLNFFFHTTYFFQGDSGGPLLIAKDGNPCVHYVVGITSFGKYCAAANTPAVYTRVSEFVSWIEREVW